MRIVFVGAVESSVIALEALIRMGRAPTLVVTLPPELAGRHSDFADLGAMGRAAGCAVRYASDINQPDVLEAMAAVEPDLTFVIGWSQVCRQAFRDVARLGTIGFHPAALPRLRGRAVIPWTILRGEEVTGSTLFWLDEGIDSGPILLQRLFAVAADETARNLYAKHTTNLREMVVEAIALVETDNPPRREQDHDQASYCAKRSAEDGLIDWNAPAVSVLRLIRAVGAPYPGAFSFYSGERVRIDAAVEFENAGRYIGLVGQVQCHSKRGFVVLCGDGACIEVVAWASRTGRRPAVHGRFRPHAP
ncbi:MULTISPECIES: methionyl-tRNA formyltransferase [Sinorhizobium]|uniref:methionyl-tRNA formyltransferase n=1 Tax=Sinorhizobium TaxID=28105 RepID=UPI000BE7E3D0|nr:MULTISPECIES: methionyl-tRNA formyltransferase [Sinorhizobium]PDT52895.1 methionyl-tRNA formyltransferase [Sinorhizobium sp. NG07B]POH29067.1 methionyl-tRNA formyltransferase [Sinorhizobium americanum]